MDLIDQMVMAENEDKGSWSNQHVHGGVGRQTGGKSTTVCAKAKQRIHTYQARPRPAAGNKMGFLLSLKVQVH